MEKPEPLKGKLNVRIDNSTNKVDYKIDVFDERDVRSAVDWLKGKLYAFEDKDFEYYKIEKLIDQAFPDLREAKK